MNWGSGFGIFVCLTLKLILGLLWRKIVYSFIIWRFGDMDNIVKYDKIRCTVPIWQKANLTVEEAAVYSGIGQNKIRELSDKNNCPFVLWVGTKRMIKRRQFDNYIEKQFSI